MNAASPSSQRGLVLLEQRRYAEAEKYFRESLAGDPQDAFALFHLAVCQSNQDHNTDALASVEQALRLEPEIADFFALRALILVDLRRTRESLAASGEALRLEPDSDFAFTARAAALLAKNEWPTAEAAARKALELNPDNAVAANQLAHALRFQNRLEESAGQTAYMLAQEPENSNHHAAAGWLALQSGDRRKAEEHFLEALRLEPGSEAARAGLKEAFKARSPIYRAYLAYCFFMQRFTGKMQWLLILGLVFGIQLIKYLPAAVALPIGVGYFLFVLWVHVARAVGNFQLLFDRFARHALDRAEKWEAVFVGGGVLLGLPLFVAGLLLALPVALIAGLTLVGAAFPMAYTFTNVARNGRIVFGAVAAFIYFTGAAHIVQYLQGGRPPEWLASLPSLAVLAVVAVTWLCNIPSLNRRH